MLSKSYAMGKDGITYVISQWCARKEIPQTDVVDLIYKVWLEAKMPTGMDDIPELKKDIAEIYADTLGY